MNEMHDLVAPYLLGSLDEGEHQAFEEHLNGCEQCRAELVELEPGLATLAMANAVTTPDELKNRILGAIETPIPPVEYRESTERRERSWTRLLVPAAAILIVILGSFAIFGNDPIDDVINAPDATTVALTHSDAYTGSPPTAAQVVFSPGHSLAVLEIHGISPPAGSNVYEMWLIGADGPVAAGTFRPGADGVIRVLIDGSVEPGLIVGVTEEPAGGLVSPTGDLLFSAEL